jgi:nucleotide-binding universal stress UspA family protein
MYSKILVPLDGSKTAEAVLPYSKFLAETLHLPVQIVHAIDPQTVAPAVQTKREMEYLQGAAASPGFTECRLRCQKRARRK